MPASSQRGRSSSHDLGRYRSASSRAWKRPWATPKWTVTMPSSTLPTQPRYCLCTPGVFSPFLTLLVSSMTPTVPSGSAGSVGRMPDLASKLEKAGWSVWNTVAGLGFEPPEPMRMRDEETEDEDFEMYEMQVRSELRRIGIRDYFYRDPSIAEAKMPHCWTLMS